MLRRGALAIMGNRIKGKQFYLILIRKDFVFKTVINFNDFYIFYQQKPHEHERTIWTGLGTAARRPGEVGTGLGTTAGCAAEVWTVGQQRQPTERW
jgi:hypothetical protein